ncbi:MAG: DNA polymerase I [Eubacteriales bacterium]|nr:DNA polymerase I [Lachnospiraceae bacterium]MDO5127970.1 DNA polymerase I [Eubacteriales bacterium]
MTNKILLIDGNSILNRAFYGLPDLTTADGRHTNAVLGFINIVLKVIDEEQATHVCVAFDVKKPTFRHEMFKEYKGTRKPMPEELREQVPMIKEVLRSMNIHMIEQAGYEADDIIGTMSRKAKAEGYSVTILSGDRDLLQLATDSIMIRLPKTKAGKTIIETYYAEDVENTYGVDPITFIDLKGLMGDTSDNIPGVPGVGEKTAAKLLAEYGSLDGIYEKLDMMKQSKLKDNLIIYKEQAYLSKILATIKLDCDINDRLDEMKFYDAFNEKAFQLFSDLEFKSLLNRFDASCKSQAVRISGRIIEDYNLFLEYINGIKLNAYIGFSFVYSERSIVGLSICASDDETVLVPVVNFITEDVLKDAIYDLRNTGITLVCMDIKQMLPDISFNENDHVFDISVAAYLMNPMKSQYYYDDIAKDYLGVSVESEKELVAKQTISYFSFEDEKINRYLSYLSYVAYKAYPIMLQKLKEMDLYDLYHTIELPCVYALYDMEKNGIYVDKDALVQFGQKLKVRIDELTATIYDLAGEQFNINSTKQLGEILFEKLQLPGKKKTKTGYSTNVDVLEKIKNEHPIISAILEYRQLTKLNSTYVEGLSVYIGDDGRIHGKFNQTVTATGRISSTEPNLQNIPTRLPLGREIRKVFKPQPGYVFLDADYSQIELRVLAHLSNDQTLIDAYHKDRDIHTITASEVFGVPMDAVDDLMRRRAKAVNFGIVYGISSFGLGQDLDISRKEAEQYIEKYFSTYSNVKGFMDKTVADAKKLGYTVTLFKRRRPIPELNSSNFMTRSFGERAAMNSPIQGTAADIIKIAMLRVNKVLKERGLKSRIVLQVHDELLVETAKDELHEVERLLVHEMEHAANLKVPLLVDVQSGSSWYDAK